MILANLDRGDKRDVHLNLYQSELSILDALAERYNSSRSLVLGELLRTYASADLAGVEQAVRPDRRARKGT